MPKLHRNERLEKLISQSKDRQAKRQKTQGKTNTKSGSAQDRFLSKILINDSGCWIWQGSVGENGYGQFKYKGTLWRAHRAAYDMFVSPLTDTLYVCHHCDTPTCVNPRHLFLGTAKDNMEDCFNKGRHTNIFLEKNKPANHKLDKRTAGGILLYFIDNPNAAPSAVAEMFGVPRHIVSDIKRGRAYYNLNVEYPIKTKT